MTLSSPKSRSIVRSATSVCLGLAVFVSTIVIGTGPSVALPPETRCGWISNPTPANWTLVDRNGSWTVGTQGGHQAAGMSRMPDFDRSAANWVVTNTGQKGYGCACLRVETNRRRMQVVRITSVRQQPLAVCRADRRLPRFE